MEGLVSVLNVAYFVSVAYVFGAVIYTVIGSIKYFKNNIDFLK
jgi:hypothetical protein